LLEISFLAQNIPANRATMAMITQTVLCFFIAIFILSPKDNDQVTKREKEALNR
jgi:hypothetical protein